MGREWGRGGRKYAPEILAAGQKGVMGKKRLKKQEGPAGRYGWPGMEAKRGRLGVTKGPAWRLRGAGWALRLGRHGG